MQMISKEDLNDFKSQNLKSIELNLAHALQNQFSKMDRYIQELPRWKNGEMQSPGEYDPFNPFKERGSITAKVYDPKSVEHLRNIKSTIGRLEILNGDQSNYLQIVGATQPADLLTYNGMRNNHSLVEAEMQTQTIINTNHLLKRYIAYAETVVNIATQLWGGLWDKENDSVRYYSSKECSTFLKHEYSADMERFGQALGSTHIAQLILHLREVERLQKLPKSSQTAVIPYKTGNQYPLFSAQQAKQSRYLLSENNLVWLKHQICNVVRNGDYNHSERHSLESNDERRERLKSDVILILTTNLRSLFTGAELLSLVSSSAALFHERVERPNYVNNMSNDGMQLLTNNNTNFASNYLNAQRAPGLTQFFESLAPAFVLNMIVEKLKKEKASVEFLLIALFGDKEQIKALEDTSCQAKGVSPWMAVEGIAFVEYDELIEICAIHFDFNKNDIFAKAYKLLTGQDRPNSQTKKSLATSSKDIKDAFAGLNLPVTATFDEVKKQFRKFALQFHPDKNPNDPIAVEKFRNVNEQYKLLCDYFNPNTNNQNANDVEAKTSSNERCATESSGTCANKNNPITVEDEIEASSRLAPPLSSAQEFSNYTEILRAVRFRITGHTFEISGNGEKNNDDGVGRSKSANLILELINALIISKAIVSEKEFEEIKQKIKSELKDKTQLTKGFLGLGARSLSTVQLYLDILKLLNEKPKQSVTYDLPRP